MPRAHRRRSRHCMWGKEERAIMRQVIGPRTTTRSRTGKKTAQPQWAKGRGGVKGEKAVERKAAVVEAFPGSAGTAERKDTKGANVVNSTR